MYEPQKHTQNNFLKKWPPAPKNMLKILKYHPKKYDLHPPPIILSKNLKKHRNIQ